jgi:hypothetical protein
MGNKLYEEEEVRQIAISLRANAPRKIGQKELLLSEMSSSVDDVYLEGYENGYKDITENPNTEENIHFTVTETSVSVKVDSGYYDKETVTELDVQRGDLDPIVDAAYDRGYSDGYDEGLSEGSGGGGSLDDTIRIFAPIFIQNEATKITATSYDNQQVYYYSDFENAVVGNITYNWQDDITTQVTASVTSITLTAQNNNPLLSVVVCVAVEYRQISGTLVATKHIYVDVPPLSSNTKQITFSKIGVGKIPYSHKVHYLKFSLGGN